MRLIPVISWFLAILGLLSAAQAAVVGADDRQVVAAQSYPWSAIGRLSKGDGSLCSGVLVGPSLALTVAHCLWDDRRQDWAYPEAVFFSAGVDLGGVVGVSGVETYEIAGDYDGAPDQRLENVAHDWALLHLREPLGLRAGYLGLYPLTAETYRALGALSPVVIRAGYSLPQRNRQLGQVGCQIVGWARAGVLAHTCDAMAGDSGSPLFAHINGTWRVIALHASSFQDPVSGGQRLSAAVPVGDAAPFAQAVGAQEAGGIGSQVVADQGLLRALDANHALTQGPHVSNGLQTTKISGPGMQE
jgi:protease YdgD